MPEIIRVIQYGLGPIGSAVARHVLERNHLQLVGSITKAVRRARAVAGPRLKIEVEVTTADEVLEAVAAGADMIMLDNMPIARMRPVVRELRGRVPVEVSGKVRLGQVRRIAGLGVDFISVGALTHSYASIDISLEFEGDKRDGRK